MKIPMQQLPGHIPDVVSTLKPIGPLPESTPLDVVIALPVRNAELRTTLLRDIYDPASPHFHQYLSPNEYMETFDPTEASYQGLLDFVEANEATVVSTAPQKFIRTKAATAEINRMFHVTLQQYQHPTEDRLFYAPDVDPAVELETPVSQITGLDNFRMPRRAPNLIQPHGKASSSPLQAGGSGSGGLYTGGDFRAAYAPGVTLTGSGQAVGILQLDGYIDTDIKMYEQKNGIPKVPLQNVYVDGYTGGNPNEESAGDIELVISMAPGLAKVIIYGAPYSDAGIVDILHEMANPTKGEPLPYQITTSYYFTYNKNVYDALARLAVQGQALFVASGDFGSYNEATGSGAFPPADHPLIISVGGTELQTSGPGGAWTAETAATFSGGGYSPWGGDPQFAIPWWQAGMDYTASKGSTTVRNAPDVSIVANNITVYSNSSWRGFAGTSAAAPLWAGFMALVNEQAAASRRPPVGFASPALWAIGRDGKYPTCFHDITTGNNFNKTNPNLYSAVAGYDLVTGWGTPNGKDLIDALVGYGPGWAGLLPNLRIAFQINTGDLWLLTAVSAHDLNLGMMTGTSPSITATPGGYAIAFQANTGDLWVHTSDGAHHDLNLGMMTGTSPSITATPGGYAIAFQANTGDLWVHTSDGAHHDLNLGMMTGTSPSITATPGGYAIAFQANTGDLWVHTSDGAHHDLNLGMMTGTSPSITATPGGYAIAFQANTGDLWVHTSDGAHHDLNLGMMTGTSPSITATPGGYAIAFQANTGDLWVHTSDGAHHDLNLGMMTGTSPSITATPGGYAIAFQANTGDLWVHTSDGAHHDLNFRMMTGTSPALK